VQRSSKKAKGTTKGHGRELRTSAGAGVKPKHRVRNSEGAGASPASAHSIAARQLNEFAAFSAVFMEADADWYASVGNLRKERGEEESAEAALDIAAVLRWHAKQIRKRAGSLRSRMV
jgi:hypothetical protein